MLYITQLTSKIYILVLINVFCDQMSAGVGGSYFDSDDVAGLLESNFEDLPTGAAADLPLTDQVCHLCWIPLWTDRHK